MAAIKLLALLLGGGVVVRCAVWNLLEYGCTASR
jgi:hypothetical protein